MPATEHKRKRRLFGVAALAIGIFAGLFAAEVVLRLVGFSSPEFYQADEVYGYSLIPGMQGTYTKEGRSQVTINSAGFRDRERDTSKSANVFRIAVIGDSYVEALQVEAYERFTQVAEEMLNRDCPGPRATRQFEVLPFGVSGYGTAQEYLMLRHKVLSYSPDAVLLVVTTNNDITDNVRELKKTPIPYFDLVDGELRLDESFRTESSFRARNSAIGRLGTWIKNSFRVVQAAGELSLTFKYWYRQKFRAAFVASAADVAAAPEVGIDNQVYLEPRSEIWRKAWTVTEAIILGMRNEAPQFLLATASNGVQVLPDVSQRNAYARSLGIEDLSYPNRRIGRLARENRIPFLDLAVPIGEYAAANNAFLHGFEDNRGYGHWNRLGHEVAGRAAAQFLCRELK